MTEVELQIFQGDDPDAMRNVQIGTFRVSGLRPVAGPNVVLCRMRLDLDGILHVTAIEKATGLSKHVSINGATRNRDSTEIASSKAQIDRLFADRTDIQRMEFEDINSDAVSTSAEGVVDEEEEPAPTFSENAGTTLIDRCRTRMPSMHADDREEAVNLIEAVSSAMESRDEVALDESSKALSEFLFFIEGR